MTGVDDLADQPIGVRIQTLRERRGKSRAVVASLVGKSEEWLKKVERGRLQPPRLDMLVRLAEALGLSDLAEITGQQTWSLPMSTRAGHDSVPAVREAIEAHPMTVPDGTPPDAAELVVRAADAWALWHTSVEPRTAVGAILPRIITEGRRAIRVLDGPELRQAHAALANAYALAEQLLAWVADSPLLWLAADRCMASAEQADDPATLALAAWVVGNVWRATGREEDAYLLALDAADLLEPQLAGADDTPRALWGAVRLHSALTAGRMGREGDALRLLDDGAAMAARLPGGYAHPSTLFGAPNAALAGVSVHVDLQQGGRAITAADAVDPDSIPSVDRRARLWLELARGYRQRKDNTAALHVLQRATATSTESMRCHPLARTLASELVTSGGRIVERDARALAATLGLNV
jgi:transcriptional regulator with XRE-family HTH domain